MYSGHVLESCGLDLEIRLCKAFHLLSSISHIIIKCDYIPVPSQCIRCLSFRVRRVSFVFSSMLAVYKTNLHPSCRSQWHRNERRSTLWPPVAYTPVSTCSAFIGTNGANINLLPVNISSEIPSCKWHL